MGIISFCKKLLKRNHTYTSGNSIEWFGTNYGGFYLDGSLISPEANLFSFGVGEDISFDLAVSERGIRRAYLFDPTPKSIEFVKQTGLPGNFEFRPLGISDKDEEADFFLPRNEKNVSGSLLVHKQLDTGKTVRVQLKRLTTILTDLKMDHIDILKIDIEGSEYKVLKNIIAEGIYPVQICVEFHNSFYSNGKKMFEETLALLKRHNYEVKGISTSGHEYLFVRNK